MKTSEYQKNRRVVQREVDYDRKKEILSAKKSFKNAKNISKIPVPLKTQIARNK